MSLTNLNIGDSVTVISRGKADRIQKITRITKTTIVTENSYRFNIDTGYKIPKENFTLHYTRIEPTTQEHIRTIRRQQMIDKLMSFSFNKLNDEQLENVIKAISGEVIK